MRSGPGNRKMRVRPSAIFLRTGRIRQTCRFECCDLRVFLVIRPGSTCYPGNVGLGDPPQTVRKMNGIVS
jgi:hypothetical protein